MRQLLNRKISGFTIVELLIVIVVIGILSALVIVSYGGITQGARDKSLESDAEGVATEITRYSTKNDGTLGTAVAWYSGGSDNANIKFTPSPGNIIDIVANTTDYCIRVYNPSSNKKTISTAETKESTPGVCTTLAASLAAGGTWDGSLVGWWKLNGNANDETGNGYNGVIVGATPAIGQNGEANSAYSFNGTNQYITIAKSGGPIRPLVNSLTMSAWIKGTTLYDGQLIFSTSMRYSANGISLATINNKPRFTTFTVKDYDASSVSLITNTWYMLTAVMGSDNNVGFYVNGVLAQTITHSMSGIANNDDNLMIGAFTGPGSSTPGGFFAGIIDDIRVYNRTLTGSEITAIYNAGAK